MKPPKGKNYQIGYGQPPESGRWKKGQHGGSALHRQRERTENESDLAMMDRHLMSPVWITEGGERKRVPAIEAIVLMLWKREIENQDTKATKVRIQFEQLATQVLPTRIELRLIESDYTRAISSKLIQGNSDD